ncbi:MAG TPA: ABC transporter substrate-binding protein [Syntrophorhabdaceae bacterium]|nr:ABC transporter substrate-binding protein [Syntrophorhabdaceae bacterium]
MRQTEEQVFRTADRRFNRFLRRKFLPLPLLICLGGSFFLLLSMTALCLAQGASTGVKKQQPRYGGVLRIGTAIDANVLGYPPGMLTTQDFVTSKTCIESLGRYDSTGQMHPWLAESWTPNAKAKTVTLKLRKGIKFHDGTSFNASACKWNLEKFINAKRAELSQVKSIDIIDDYTLRINLADWDNTVNVGVGYFAGPQISPTAWQKAGTTDKERDDWVTNNPIGTGPFQFVSRQRDIKQVYKKFDGYWQKGKPYLDGIEWNFIADPMVLQAAFKTKELDILWNIPPLAAKDLRASGADIIELRTGLGLQMIGVMPNSALTGSPFANLKLRQAISCAIDRKAIVDTVYYGFAVATQQWGVPNGFWANPNYKGYPYDPARAKQLVTEAGYPTGVKTTLLVLNVPEMVTAATAIQGMLAKAGINVELDVADNARYRRLTSETHFEGLCYSTHRADSDLAIVMPRQIGANGPILAKNIIHPEKIEKLLVDAKKAPDQKSKRAEIWKLQQTVFGEYNIFTPMFVISGLAAKQPHVRDDSLMTVEYTQWTPEDAWMAK